MPYNIFIDMDGTLAEWKAAEYEDLLSDGYFYKLSPYGKLVGALKELMSNPELDVNFFILSTVLAESPYVIRDKNRWLNEFLPIPTSKRLFAYVPKPECAEGFLGRKLTRNDILLDDYTKNLLEWGAAGGTSVKVFNGVNGTKNPWQGAFSLSVDDDKETIIESILYALDRVENNIFANMK